MTARTAPSTNGKTATYPKRPAFFAHEVVRKLFKTCAAQEIGQPATLLVVFVAHTEDAKRYTAPPTFYNDQLLAILGIRKWDTLDRARRAASDAGWLHYQAPPNGARQAGVYWSTIPERFQDIDDAPIGGTPYPVNGEGQKGPYPANGDGMGDGCGDGIGDGMGELSSLTLFPSPSPKNAPADAGPPAELLKLIDGWNQMPEGVVMPGNGARRDPIAKATLRGWNRAQKEPEQREALSDIPRLLDAIKRAKFCHGEGWFTIPWLFGTNKHGEFNLVKLLNGSHNDANGNGRPKQTVGDGQRFRTADYVGSSRVDLQACKLEYSIVSPK